MTTGTNNRQYWTPVSTSCSASDKYGRSFVKTWTGTDRIPVAAKYVYLVNPETKKWYRKRVREQRKDTPNPYSMTATETVRDLKTDLRNSNPSDCNPLNYNVQWSEAFNCFLDIRSWSDPFTSNDQLKLLSKLHTRVWGSDFDPGVFLAEGQSSLRLISEAATKVATGLSHFKRGHFTRAWMVLTGGKSERRRPVIDTRKGLANGWSEFRWGWVPLYNDMYQGAEWLAHQLHAPVSYRIAVTRNTVMETGFDKGVTAGYRHRTRAWSHSRRLIAYLNEPPHNSAMNAINPASIAWELVPYSFVADWAIPIGTYLKVRGLPSTLSGTFVTSDRSWKRCLGVAYFQQTPCGPKNINRFGYNDKSETFAFTRTVSSSLDIPTPTFRGFGTVATWMHAVDSLALLTQAFKKRPGPAWDRA